MRVLTLLLVSLFQIESNAEETGSILDRIKFLEKENKNLKSRIEALEGILTNEDKNNSPFKAKNIDPKKEITFYLTRKNSEILPLADLEVVTFDRETLEKVLKVRQSIKEHYAKPIVSEELINNLKEKGYNGTWIPQEIDNVEPLVNSIAKESGVAKGVIFSDASSYTFINGLLGARDLIGFDKYVDKLTEDQRMRESHKHTYEAAKASKVAAKIITESKSFKSYRTDISGKVSLSLKNDQFVFASAIISNTLVAWILPVSYISEGNVEINNRSAFILKYIPTTARGLRDEIPQLKFFFVGKLITQQYAQSALILSDEFYIAAKTVMGNLRSENWGLKFEDE